MLVNRLQLLIALTVLPFILLCCCGLSLADENDARLEKRIAELEAENVALRKVIANIQSAVQSVPDSTPSDSTKANHLRIVILPGEWGASELVDIRKVCESAAATLMNHLPTEGFAPIMVQHDNSGPITLYKRGQGNEYIVQLDTSDRAWAQLAFQFAHEFCHVICNYRDAKNQQLWFEETLCECASLYALKQMAAQWKTNAPYANWKSYSTSLRDYADERISAHTAGRKDSIAQFYRDNQTELYKSGTNRALNTYLAIKLLPLFEATPTAWQALRYINLGSAEENVSFQAYLNGWLDRAPKKHHAFIRQIANEFDLKLMGRNAR
ncbi:MAG: hypothetical protein HN617_15530 [Planctomycetaceae bacterium]|nr:hypothetical protein [Planctomycetaceae bacterium]MBT4012332.1 hypothetical protein [Planctomycetaceae bacterium]MBT4726259.1 hypothetical protein [Planctomycetaceae bacterium]MBT5125674.1 hypothetical protein [Planctomycetaceae bacterium]MBT5599425.1 hypothetical protein [Planctomycetaceae bacterium]